MKCIENEIPFDIPDSWAWARLVSLIEAFITGPFGSALHKSDYVADGIPLINPMNITDGKVIPIDKMQVSPETAERLSSFKVAPSDIVIARRGDMGRCAVVQPAQEGWLCGTGSLFCASLQFCVLNILLSVYALLTRLSLCLEILLVTRC